jgi:hypothetical protein
LARKATVFNAILTEAVDDAFSSLGTSAKQAIYYHLEDKFKITRNDIPNRLSDFEIGLEKIFGSGSKFLEILIMKRLYERIGHPLEWDEDEELAFANYVATARQSYLKRKS